jgi:putative ubiquitin-RnfH superfamily antitoxin RatB of RatAB toxin-antitoxin module
MTKKNPDESVLDEQSGANDNATGTEETTHAEKAIETESPGETPQTPISPEKSEVKEKKRTARPRVPVPVEGKPAAVEKHDQEHDHEKVLDEIVLPPVDYSGYSKSELVNTLGLIIENRPPAEIRNDVDRIKILFYKKLKQEAEEKKNKFVEDGGKVEEYRAWVDPTEARVKHLLEKYKEKKSDYNKVQEAEKYENLKKKYEIIDKIKELVNREESINKTFHEFRYLQNEWHAIGVVPQNSLKDLWENYHHNVEIFYDYIKINKELKDLDLKKNLESKMLLCEKAEQLMLEPNPVNAFRFLQDYHNQWREIGPVPQESKNEIWERFKEATSQINKRHHEYFEKQKDDQRKNLDSKITLCEEVEAINLLEIKNFRDFDDKAAKVVALQKMWRTIGFAPKKQNNKVYQRFREACDAFFEKKRGFYADNKEVQQTNLQKKIDLCVQAEALQDSTDWKATSDALIKLQKEWKEIGPVPRKQSEKSWKRFRKACDQFFNKKTEFFAELDTSYEDNLKGKLAVIEELEAFEPGADVQAAFDRLKELQRKWTEIGFVPFNKKEEITNRYRNALNKEFDKLKIADEDKSILKYRTKLDGLKANPKASRKVHNEREKFFTKIKQLESDIVLWENNIGFFTKSVNADNMIREVEEKIENAKKMIKTLEEKVKMIDQSGLDD